MGEREEEEKNDILKIMRKPVEYLLMLPVFERPGQG